MSTSYLNRNRQSEKHSTLANLATAGRVGKLTAIPAIIDGNSAVATLELSAHVTIDPDEVANPPTKFGIITSYQRLSAIAIVIVAPSTLNTDNLPAALAGRFPDAASLGFVPFEGAILSYNKDPTEYADQVATLCTSVEGSNTTIQVGSSDLQGTKVSFVSGRLPEESIPMTLDVAALQRATGNPHTARVDGLDAMTIVTVNPSPDMVPISQNDHQQIYSDGVIWRGDYEDQVENFFDSTQPKIYEKTHLLVTETDSKELGIPLMHLREIKIDYAAMGSLTNVTYSELATPIEGFVDVTLTPVAYYLKCGADGVPVWTTVRAPSHTIDVNITKGTNGNGPTEYHFTINGSARIDNPGASFGQTPERLVGIGYEAIVHKRHIPSQEVSCDFEWDFAANIEFPGYFRDATGGHSGMILKGGYSGAWQFNVNSTVAYTPDIRAINILGRDGVSEKMDTADREDVYKDLYRISGLTNGFLVPGHEMGGFLNMFNDPKVFFSALLRSDRAPTATITETKSSDVSEEKALDGAYIAANGYYRSATPYDSATLLNRLARAATTGLGAAMKDFAGMRHCRKHRSNYSASSYGKEYPSDYTGDGPVPRSRAPRLHKTLTRAEGSVIEKIMEMSADSKGMGPNGLEIKSSETFLSLDVQDHSDSERKSAIVDLQVVMPRTERKAKLWRLVDKKTGRSRTGFALSKTPRGPRRGIATGRGRSRARAAYLAMDIVSDLKEKAPKPVSAMSLPVEKNLIHEHKSRKGTYFKPMGKKYTPPSVDANGRTYSCSSDSIGDMKLNLEDFATSGGGGGGFNFTDNSFMDSPDPVVEDQDDESPTEIQPITETFKTLEDDMYNIDGKRGVEAIETFLKSSKSLLRESTGPDGEYMLPGTERAVAMFSRPKTGSLKQLPPTGTFVGFSGGNGLSATQPYGAVPFPTVAACPEEEKAQGYDPVCIVPMVVVSSLFAYERAQYQNYNFTVGSGAGKDLQVFIDMRFTDVVAERYASIANTFFSRYKQGSFINQTSSMQVYVSLDPKGAEVEQKSVGGQSSTLAFLVSLCGVITPSLVTGEVKVTYDNIPLVGNIMAEQPVSSAKMDPKKVSADSGLVYKRVSPGFLELGPVKKTFQKVEGSVEYMFESRYVPGMIYVPDYEENPKVDEYLRPKIMAGDIHNFLVAQPVRSLNEALIALRAAGATMKNSILKTNGRFFVRDERMAAVIGHSIRGAERTREMLTKYVNSVYVAFETTQLNDLLKDTDISAEEKVSVEKRIRLLQSNVAKNDRTKRTMSASKKILIAAAEQSKRKDADDPGNIVVMRSDKKVLIAEELDVGDRRYYAFTYGKPVKWFELTVHVNETKVLASNNFFFTDDPTLYGHYKKLARDIRTTGTQGHELKDLLTSPIVIDGKKLQEDTLEHNTFLEVLAGKRNNITSVITLVMEMRIGSVLLYAQRTARNTIPGAFVYLPPKFSTALKKRKGKMNRRQVVTKFDGFADLFGGD